MTGEQPATETPHYLLHDLRALIPGEELTLASLFSLLDRLAMAIRLDAGIFTDDLPDSVAAQVCRLRLEETDLPVAGFSYWDSEARAWAVARNPSDSVESRRFTLWHEIGHILWRGNEARLFANLSAVEASHLAEYAAEYFAGEVLMPRRLVEHAFHDGINTPSELADRFRVSPLAMRWKLAQTDLPEVSSDDHDGPMHPTERYPVPPFSDVAHQRATTRNEDPR